jgi:nucleoside-diphosphate-sugar epimerase
MSIVVTGGAGFIGSHAANALLAKGLVVTAFGDLSSGQRENLAAPALIPMSDFGRSGTTLSAPSAMCHAP